MKTLLSITISFCSALLLLATTVLGQDTIALQFEYDYFLATDTKDQTQILIQKSLYYKDKDDWISAQQTLARIAPEDSSGKYQTALLHFIQRDFVQCLELIDRFGMRDRCAESQQMQLLSVMHIYGVDSCAALIPGGLYDSEMEEIKADISPFKAMKRSMLLPGLGQIYAGRPAQAATSVLFVSGFTVLAAVSFTSGLWVSGAVWGVYPAFRFYAGGVQNSYKLAQKHNEKNTKIKIDLCTQKIVAR